MDFDISKAATMIAILAAVYGAVLGFFKLYAQSLDLRARRFELFQKLQALCGTDARQNYTALTVGLRNFTERKLCPAEMEWFLHIPGAISYLHDYGRGEQYVELDIQTNRFIYKKEYRRKMSRYWEYAKINTAFLILCFLGGILLQFTYFKDFLPIFTWQILGIGLCLYSTRFAAKSSRFTDATKLINVQIDIK